MYNLCFYDVGNIPVHVCYSPANQVKQYRLRKIETLRNNFIEKIISCAGKGLRIEELQQIYEESKIATEKAVQEVVNKKISKVSSDGDKKHGCIIQ